MLGRRALVAGTFFVLLIPEPRAQTGHPSVLWQFEAGG